MATALPMAIAPAMTTSLFAYSIKYEVLGGHLIWVVLFAIGTSGFLFSLTLQEPTHDWRKVVTDDDNDD